MVPSQASGLCGYIGAYEVFVLGSKDHELKKCRVRADYRCDRQEYKILWWQYSHESIEDFPHIIVLRF